MTKEYICTFHDDTNSNSQKGILFELPLQEIIDEFGPMKVLLTSSGCKDVKYIQDAAK